MTALKQKPQILVAGLVGLVVVIAAILGFSGTFMGAEEAAAPVELPVETEATPVGSAADGDAAFSGSFDPDGTYAIFGQALVLEGADGSQTLRLTEDFQTPAGPRLVVYLRAESGDFVNLGPLELSGEQDFEIPEGVDITEFSEVQIWCEPFSINFGSAFLS